MNNLVNINDVNRILLQEVGLSKDCVNQVYKTLKDIAIEAEWHDGEPIDEPAGLYCLCISHINNTIEYVTVMKEQDGSYEQIAHYNPYMDDILGWKKISLYCAFLPDWDTDKGSGI